MPIDKESNVANQSQINRAKYIETQQLVLQFVQEILVGILNHQSGETKYT